MQDHRRFGTTLVATVFFLVASALGAPQVFAFRKRWVMTGSVNVSPYQVAFYDDIPGAHLYQHAGLLMFMNFRTTDESVTYTTTDWLPVDNHLYNRIVVRAAVSENGKFSVGYGTSTTAGCRYPGLLTWMPSNSSGLYRTKSYILPADTVVRKICLSLSDYPDTINSGKTSALISRIWIDNASTGEVGWVEGFLDDPW